ncbi:MAG: sensor histidine kinase [Syntrophobacteraceae bacterium]
MKDRNAKIAELRNRAMETLKSKSSSMEKMPVEDVRKLVEELQIHQIELEMQNEELRSIQYELEQSRKKYSDLYDFAPVGYLTINEEGRIVEANLTAAKQLGMERSILIGKPFNLYAAEDYREELHIHLRKVFKTKQPHTCEIKLNGRSLTNSYVQLDSTYLLDSDGQNLTRTTMTDISDRKQAEEKLKVFAGKLEQSNQELEQFAFIASHDLQEPLRKIQAFGNMLGNKCSDQLNEQGKDYITRMQNAAKRMQQLIGDLLKYSRVAARPEPLDTVDLREAVAEVISDLEPRIVRLGANVEVFDLPAIKAGKSQIRQLFQNLMVNALKFHGNDQPHIKIYSQRTDHDCRIFVEDNGIGFDEKYIERIFMPFQRLHGRSAYEGTGMGLAICRRIVERYGGSITAKGKPGEGSTFIITLPVKQNS